MMIDTSGYGRVQRSKAELKDNETLGLDDHLIYQRRPRSLAMTAVLWFAAGCIGFTLLMTVWEILGSLMYDLQIYPGGPR